VQKKFIATVPWPLPLPQLQIPSATHAVDAMPFAFNTCGDMEQQRLWGQDLGHRVGLF